MFTVCQGIADQYRRDTGVTPVVLTNAPEYHDIRAEPESRPESTDLTRDAAKIRMIHHGAASPPREIERMILAMRHLDERFELDFLLVPGSMAYIARLEARWRSQIQGFASCRRCRCASWCRFSSAYDIGVFLVPPTTFNLRHTLPNKFFEFIQARLAVAVGPSPEMARIVEQNGCGVVASRLHARGAGRCAGRARPRTDQPHETELRPDRPPNVGGTQPGDSAPRSSQRISPVRADQAGTLAA